MITIQNINDKIGLELVIPYLDNLTDRNMNTARVTLLGMHTDNKIELQTHYYMKVEVDYNAHLKYTVYASLNRTTRKLSIGLSSTVAVTVDVDMDTLSDPYRLLRLIFTQCEEHRLNKHPFPNVNVK